MSRPCPSEVHFDILVVKLGLSLASGNGFIASRNDLGSWSSLLLEVALFP